MLPYWLTKDEVYAETFARHLESWMEQNPPEIGINWLSSLEISFRVMSWIWAFHFFKGAESFTPALFQKALKFLYLQGRHIEKYLSTYYSPNTHLTGEALGLYYLGTQFPFFFARLTGAIRAKKFCFPNSTGRFSKTAFILNRRRGISVTRLIFTRIF